MSVENASSGFNTEALHDELPSEDNNEEPSEPGEPTVLSCTSVSVQLMWEPPKRGKNIIEGYEIRFKESQSKKWETYCTDGKQTDAIVSHLKSESTYMFRVRALYGDGEEGPFSSTNKKVQTKSTLGSEIIATMTKKTEGKPAIYQLPIHTSINTTNKLAKTRKCVFGKRNPTCIEKTIMVVSATGAGKSTLIDGMVNYILDVNWTDDFRFSLVDLTDDEKKNKGNEAQSQTEWISCYNFYRLANSQIEFNLNIIDTPGFGDTRGIARDKKIVDQIREFFTTPGDQGIDTLDAVCFVTQAPLARLTPPQKYIFDAILSVFGQDIASNIFVLITFADGNEPPVIAALKSANVPFKTSFKFNNSALFASTDVSQSDESKFGEMFWKMGRESFRIFFDELYRIETRSLKMTAEVLQTRKHLEAVIKGLQPQIDEGLNKLNIIRQERQVLKEHKSDIEKNKDFVYTVEEIHQRKINLPVNEYVTNCLTCNRTCHYPCGIPDNCNKEYCAAMSNGKCNVCPRHCHWSNHCNNPYRFECYPVKVQKSSEDLRKKYEVAKEAAQKHESFLEGVKSHFKLPGNKVGKMIKDVKCYINRLGDIALKPNPLSEVDYIDLLIDSEMQEKKYGWEARKGMLTALRSEAELMAKIPGQNFEPWNVKDYFED